MSANHLLTPLLPSALVGTEQKPPGAIVAPEPLASICHAIAASNDSDATKLLQTAGVFHVAAMAGFMPDSAPTLASAASEDALPVINDARLSDLIERVLREGTPRLQHLLCGTLAVHAHRLPHRCLPAALDTAQRNVSLRAVMQTVIGTRGTWLAAQRKAWQFAASGVASAHGTQPWDEGNERERTEFLTHERQRAPSGARERFANSLADMAAPERTTLIAAFKYGLSLDDEALLNQLRSDRSSEVRRIVQQLLLRLPNAAFTQRACERMSALLVRERKLLRVQWTIDAPAVFDAAWKSEHIEADRPKHESLGERAWWLYQMVKQVPLAWWCTQTEMSPHALLTWAGRSEWSEAIHRAWLEVLFIAPAPTWAQAFLDDWPKKVRETRADVLALLPIEQREQRLSDELNRDKRRFNELVQQALAAQPLGEPFSRALSQTLAELTVSQLKNDQLRHDYALRDLLPEIAASVNHAVLPKFTALARSPDETPAMAETFARLALVIDLRTTLHNFFTPQTP